MSTLVVHIGVKNEISSMRLFYFQQLEQTHPDEYHCWALETVQLVLEACNYIKGQEFQINTCFKGQIK